MSDALDQLRGLPRRPDEVWQAAVTRMPTWITGERDKPFRPDVVLWVAVQTHKVSSLNPLRPEEVDAERVLKSLAAFAADKVGGYLPGRVEVCDPQFAEMLRPAMAELGVEVRVVEHLPDMNFTIRNMIEFITGQPPVPGMLAGDGVTVDGARRFAEAAAEFYRAAPWKHLTDADLIQIESPKAPAGFRFATVMGAAGMTYGISFYDDPEELWDVHRRPGAGTDEWLKRRKYGMWSVTFNAIHDITLADADLWEEQGLPVAGPLAYPLLAGFTADGGIHRARSTVLAFVAALLRAMARTTEEQIDSGRWSVTIEGDCGSVEFTLALPGLLNPPDHKERMRRGLMPDRRAMERMHVQMNRLFEERNPKSVEEMNSLLQREMAGKPLDPGRFPPRNAKEQAQDLIFDAFESIGRRRLQLARKALALWPDCADAYVLLAEHTGDPNVAAGHYAQGVAAGERALGQERFERDAGHFWGINDTRPYMRARFGLATVLERLGRENEALDHYRELLRLNPGDNQGVRYRYLPLALKLGRDAEAARYMKESPEEASANWTYTKALLAYRVGGASTAARIELHKAIKANPQVLPLLLTDERDEELPESYSPGSHDEAVICAAELRSAFAATPGAREWLADEHRRYRKERRKREEERGKKRRR